MPDEIALPPSSSAGTAAPGELDEFAGIEPPRRMRSPILAVLAALLAGYLMFHLRTDLVYWLQGRAGPHALGDARKALLALPPPNRFVTLEGAPDRSNAALLDTRGKDEFRQFFRLLGTNSRILVLRTYGSLPNARALRDQFSGRLIGFHDLSFADSIREWFRTRVSATHFFPPAQLEAKLGQGEVELDDLAGDPVRLRADSRLALDLVFPDQVRLTLPRDRFPIAESARATLQKLGFSDAAPVALPVRLPDPAGFYLLYGRPRPELRDAVEHNLKALSPQVQVTPDPADPAQIYAAIPKSVYPEGPGQALRAVGNLGFENAQPPPLAFLATLPVGRRDATLDALEKLDPRIAVALRMETYEKSFGELGQQAAGLDFTHVASIKLIEPLAIPDDAQVLVEGDTPSSYWYVPLMYVLLLLFLGFNLFALREARPWRFASSTR
ncbi:MAG TPA: hypothetical protein VKN99_23445 [Polyangia bacterium]|nr:hypothetical protein [Polyangia bacterium]